MKENTYKFLAFMQRKGINAIATCITSLGIILNWTWAEIVGASLMAVNVCFGVILQGISDSFFDGKIIVDEREVD